MKDLIKPIYDTIKKDPRKIGVTAPKEHKKPFIRDKKTLGIGGVILALLTLGFSFLMRRKARKQKKDDSDDS